MLKFTKRLILNLYHLPALCRTVWKYKNGKWYFFRDESDAFLKYVVYKGQGKNLSDDVKGYILQAESEVHVRDIVRSST